MFIQVWYFLTLTLTSLLMGTSFAHTLEMPAKMNVDGQLWRTFQHTLYPYFAYVGAPVEIGAIIATAVLSYLVRAHRPAFLSGARRHDLSGPRIFRRLAGIYQSGQCRDGQMDSIFDSAGLESMA